MLVDSHAHLDDARFAADQDATIQRAWDAGVRRILTIGNGTGPDDMACGIPIAERYDWIWTSAGVHPHDASRFEAKHLDLMAQLADHPRVCAIGETGLDYHYDNSPRDVQRHVFRQQVELAAQLNLPVIIHTREADDDTAAILREIRPAKGVLHCFTSGRALADTALALGLLISFSGIVTFPKANELAAIARDVPRDRLLVETDCPYLAPVPHRGRRNEPAFVSETARFLANVRGMDAAEFSSQTSTNFSRLFSLPESA